tara:strand:- start:19 stop:603 length:585 start_codon:yes stop_codon:yes gene_type:complete
MKDKAIKNFLNSFGRKVTKQAKNNLSTAGKVVTGTLLNSIKYKLISTPKGYSLRFYSADYGDFVDKGVSGTGGTFKSGKYKGSHSGVRYYKNIKGGSPTKSPYQFGSGKGSGSIYKALDKWIVKKGIAPRDAQGKFISRLGLKIAIVRSIWIRGIQGISYYTTPMRIGLKKFPTDLLNAFNKDFMEITKNIGKK